MTARRSTRLSRNIAQVATNAPKRAVTSSDDDKPQVERVKRSDSDNDTRLADAKWQKWHAHAKSSPFPAFAHPTPAECKAAHSVLTKMHDEAVKAEFDDPDTPETIANVLDAIVVAILSQATSWNNAKRAMNSMKAVYGSIYAYDDILAGGQDKLQEALRCGGLHVRKSKIITSILQQVQERYHGWDLNHLFELSDEDAMKELISYKGMGPKSAFVVMTWCLKRQNFTVDTHVHRISGLWGWRPQGVDVQKTQAHLDATIPSELKFDLHFLLIQHGRSCPACRGGSKSTKPCEALREIEAYTG